MDGWIGISMGEEYHQIKGNCKYNKKYTTNRGEENIAASSS